MQLPFHLQNLNTPQLEAVVHHCGPILVLAGAGSGKTRVLTRRIAHLVTEHRESPRSILAVTFTNKAAGEMRERIHDLLGRSGEEVWVATFHSAALRILRRHAPKLGLTNQFGVYDDQDSKNLMKKIIKETGLDEKKYTPQQFLRVIDQCKNQYMFPSDLHKEAESKEDFLKAELYKRYQEALLKSNAMDFGDLLMNVVKLFKSDPEVLALYQHHLKFILVDEFQDTNKVQYMLIKMLAGQHNNLLVVGDDDQSIYAFRGATIKNILEFEKDFPNARVVKLEENYRSTGIILGAAHAVISKNTLRKSKKLWTSQSSGSPIVSYVASDETMEAEFIVDEIQKQVATGRKYRDIAVFYRTNAQSRAIEESITSRGIPYKIYGGLKFYDRKEVKDIIAYLKLLLNPHDTQSFLRAVNTPPRGIGPQTVLQIEQASREHRLSLVDGARVVALGNKHVKGFVEIIDHLLSALKEKRLGDLVREVSLRSQYKGKLRASTDPYAESRIENIEELEGIAETMELSSDTTAGALHTFLDRVSLSSSADIDENGEARQDEGGAVSLMTLHLAKGLEYPVVFFSGLEEGLVPHYRSIESKEASEIEEERRLCYVGITRAMNQLYMTRSERRAMFSSGDESSGFIRLPSRFLSDIPDELIEERRSRGGKSYRLDQPQEEENIIRAGTLRNSSSTRQMIMKKVKALVSGTPAPSKTLQSADQYQKLAQEQDMKRSLLGAADLTLGLRVEHPAFGNGSVIALEGDPLVDPDSLRVTVEFDKDKIQKRLIFKFARLGAIRQ